jgi:hypothetical protein
VTDRKSVKAAASPDNANRLQRTDSSRKRESERKAINKTPRVSSEPLSVCDGTVRCGSIIERRGLYVAFDAADQIIGTFTTLSAAMRAIPAVRR